VSVYATLGRMGIGQIGVMDYAMPRRQVAAIQRKRQKAANAVCSRRLDSQLAAEDSHQRFGNLPVSRHRSAPSRDGIHQDGMAAAFADEDAALRQPMLNQAAPLHGVPVATWTDRCWHV